ASLAPHVGACDRGACSRCMDRDRRSDKTRKSLTLGRAIGISPAMLRLILLLLLPQLAGCLAYGYPSLVRTPEFPVPESDVRAFRVVHKETFAGLINIPTHHIRTDEITPVDGKIPAQSEVSFPYCAIVFP